MKLLLLVSVLGLGSLAAALPNDNSWSKSHSKSHGEPSPHCSSTVTVTASGGAATVTTTSTVSSTATITKEGVIVTMTSSTTLTTPTTITCLTSGTTFTPSPLPITGGGLGGIAGQSLSLSLRGDYSEPPCTTSSTHPSEWHSTSSASTYPTGHSLCTVTVTPSPTADSTSTVTKTTTTISTSTVQLGAITETVTQTYVVASPTSFPGLNYYQYINDYNYRDPNGPSGNNVNGYGGGGYETSDWANNTNYQTSGTTQNIDFQNTGYPSPPYVCSLPNTPATDCTQWTVVFQGFLYAKDGPGNYVFAPVQPVDNEMLSWGGDKAYRTFTNNNSDLVFGDSSEPGKAVISFNYTLAANEFLPLTIIYVNGGLAAYCAATITSPTGGVWPNDPNYFLPPCPNSGFIP